MLAARFPGKSVIDLVDVPMPSLGDGEVLVRVSYCGVCGSDRKVYRNGIDVVPGHEVSGVVVDSGNTSVREGTRAAVYLPVICGACRYCVSGQTNRCINREALLGWTAPWDGGYAEYMRVPAENIIPIDDRTSSDGAVLLLDTIGTAFHAIRLSAITPSDRVLVVGCGPLGLGVVAGLKAFGVEEYFASDIFGTRLRAAEQLGAEPVTADTAGKIENVDAIIEVTGVADNIRRSIRQVNQGGKVVLVGEWEAPWEFEQNGQVILKDYSLIRSWYFPIVEFEENQRMLIEGEIDPQTLVSHTYPLSEVTSAFEQFLSGKSRKILVGPGEQL